MRSTSPEPRELLEHRAFVRALARGLTRDQADADDLEQDVWLRALERPPRHRSNLRGWLGRVAWSRSVNAHEARALRPASESRLDPADGALAPPELADDRAVKELLARSLAALDARYAEVLRLRYFEGMTPARIAALTSVPVETAHTRLRRALARLRESLDASCGGDRRHWCASLIALAARPRSTAGTAVGLVATVGIVTTLALVITATDGESLAMRDRAPAPAEAVRERDERLRLDASPVALRRASTCTSAVTTPTSPWVTGVSSSS